MFLYYKIRETSLSQKASSVCLLDTLPLKRDKKQKDYMYPVDEEKGYFDEKNWSSVKDLGTSKDINSVLQFLLDNLNNPKAQNNGAPT